MDELISTQVQLKSCEKEVQLWRQQCEDKADEVHQLQQSIREAEQTAEEQNPQNSCLTEEFSARVSWVKFALS